MPDFPIVDAHVHIYDPAKLTYPWMDSVPALKSRHEKAEYDQLTAPVTIDKMVFVEVDVAESQNLDEARYIEDFAKVEPRMQGMVAAVAMERGTVVEPQLAALAEMPIARGVRRLIQHHAKEDGWCLQPDFVAAVKLLPRYRLSFDLCIFHNQMADTIELVKRCPEVSFILDHIGKPGIKAGLREPWWGQMRELAKLPNVVCKVSGVTTEADHKSWTYDQVAPYIAHSIDCFGFDRCVFGGDWPVSELASRYSQWVGVVDRVTAGSSASDLRKLYRDTAIRFYRL